MYPPIALSQNILVKDVPDHVSIKKYLIEMENGDDDMLVEIGTNHAFGTGHYKGTYKDFSDLVHKGWRNYYKWATGYEPDRDVFNKSNRETVLDSFVGMIMVSRWNNLKKVYRFDPDLELTLASVDDVKIPVKILDKLPFNSFYIEFAPDGIFAPTFHGVFVDILKYGKKYILKLMRVTPDLKTMSGTGVFNIDEEDDEQVLIVAREDVDGKHESDPNGLRTDWEEFCFFVLNAILYLCASNADVNECPYTFRKPDAGTGAKARWKDMQILECGYAFGEIVRLHREKTEGEAIDTDEQHMIKRRKPYRPHPVKASWQHYWRGHGDKKERVLLFKQAYFAGGKASFATISRVKEGVEREAMGGMPCEQV